MHSIAYKTWIFFNSLKLLWLVEWFSLVGAIVIIAVPSQASIMLPEPPALTLEDLNNKNDLSCNDCGSNSTPDEEPSDKPGERVTEFLIANVALPASGMTSGTSLAGSSTISLSASSLSAMDNMILFDLDVSGWLSSEFRFTLPMPPHNDLSRPPRKA